MIGILESGTCSGNPARCELLANTVMGSLEVCLASSVLGGARGLCKLSVDCFPGERVEQELWRVVRLATEGLGQHAHSDDWVQVPHPRDAGLSNLSVL